MLQAKEDWESREEKERSSLSSSIRRARGVGKREGAEGGTYILILWARDEGMGFIVGPWERQRPKRMVEDLFEVNVE